MRQTLCERTFCGPRLFVAFYWWFTSYLIGYLYFTEIQVHVPDRHLSLCKPNVRLDRQLDGNQPPKKFSFHVDFDVKVQPRKWYDVVIFDVKVPKVMILVGKQYNQLWRFSIIFSFRLMSHTKLKLIRSCIFGNRYRGRRDSCAQITDGTIGTMTVETTSTFFDSSTQTGKLFFYHEHPQKLLESFFRFAHVKNEWKLRVG